MANLFISGKEAIFKTLNRLVRTRQDFKEDDNLLIDVIMESREKDEEKLGDVNTFFLGGLHIQLGEHPI